MAGRIVIDEVPIQDYLNAYDAQSIFQRNSKVFFNLISKNMTIINSDKFYREWIDWPECSASISQITSDAKKIHFHRERKSHRGIAKFKETKALLAKQVDQDFLNEIGSLVNIERLEMEVVTAEDLSPLKQLSKLQYLKIDSARKASNFFTLVEIPSLKKLFLENCKYINDLNFLNNANNLTALGIEGGMYTKQKIPTLEPLSSLSNLEALFLTSVQLQDKNLDYLASIPNLKFLRCARFAPETSFKSLRRAMPRLICNWCDRYEIRS